MNYNNEIDKTEKNLIIVVLSRFLPYWPLFGILILICLTAAWAYVRSSTPYYEASASILFKDEKKGSDHSKISESLNYLSSKKIVENEIEVLQSKSLMKEVVKNLHLYAPIYQQESRKPKLAYNSSPVSVEVQDIDVIKTVPKVFFTFDKRQNAVLINDKTYPVNTWVNTEFGNLRFTVSEKSSATNGKFFFSLVDAKSVVQNYLSRLTVTPVSKLSSVVRVKLFDEAPERAEDILKNLVKSYNTVSNQEKEDLAANTLSFVDERLKAVKHDLDSIERRIQQYKSSGEAIDISTQGNLFLNNVSTNDQQLSEINMKLAVLNQVERFAVNGNAESGIVPSTLGVSDPLLNQLLEKLYQTELEYEKTKHSTGENHPLSVSLKNEINKIKPSILQNIRSQKRSLEASRNNLHATNASYSNVIQSIPKKERDLLEISREQGIKTNVYNFLLQKREETGFSNLPSSLDYRIVDAPDASLDPVSPNKKLIYLSSVAAAFVLGVGFVLLKDLFNKKIVLRDDIESFTALPIVGEIAYKKNKDSLLLVDEKDAFISDQFQRLHTSFHYIGLNSSKKRILITSTISGEGKSFTASNLSLTLASSGKKVVLLEADLTNPSLYEKFSNKGLKGISNYLRGEIELEEIIKETEYPNLSLIPAGTPTNNSATLFMNGKIEGLINSLDEKYDYIIIDSAPVGILTDAYILSSFCDATLYVVRQDYTPKEFIQRIITENNKLNRLKNLSIVFNAIQPKAFSMDKYGYGYGYYGNANNHKKTNSKWALKRG